jgi:hypothetical protein
MCVRLCLVTTDLQGVLLYASGRTPVDNILDMNIESTSQHYNGRVGVGAPQRENSNTPCTCACMACACEIKDHQHRHKGCTCIVMLHI